MGLRLAEGVPLARHRGRWPGRPPDRPWTAEPCGGSAMPACCAARDGRLGRDRGRPATAFVVPWRPCCPEPASLERLASAHEPTSLFRHRAGVPDRARSRRRARAALARQGGPEEGHRRQAALQRRQGSRACDRRTTGSSPRRSPAATGSSTAGSRRPAAPTGRTRSGSIISVSSS